MEQQKHWGEYWPQRDFVSPHIEQILLGANMSPNVLSRGSM